jgi:hypothetical protein
MAQRKPLLPPVDCQQVSIEDHIKTADLFKPEGDRVFVYELNEKTAKAKLLKGAKRIPLLLEEHSSSSNLLFNLGSWHIVVRPSLSYWNEVKGDNSCHIGNYIIQILGVQIGKDSKGKNVDSKIVFFADGNKVVCHFITPRSAY